LKGLAFCFFLCALGFIKSPNWTGEASCSKPFTSFFFSLVTFEYVNLIQSLTMKHRSVFLSIAVLTLAWWCVPTQAADNPLVGVIDFHAHSGPDAWPRSVDDFELARLAKRAGMRGLVLKNHFTSTADRAALVMKEVEGIEVFGGIVLNGAVGGINAEAVRQMIQFDGKRGKVVWLPTVDAENEVKRRNANRPFVAVVKNGKPVPELEEVFQLIAENNLVLAMGHSSPEESLLLITQAKKAGVRKIVVTHAMGFPIETTEDQMRRLAEMGAIIECVWLTHIGGGTLAPPDDPNRYRITVAQYAKVIKSIGAEHFLIASDLGQYLNPLHTDGMKAFVIGLHEQGLSDEEIDVVARQNPARLLGLAKER